MVSVILRRVAIGIGIAIAVAIVVFFLLQHGLITGTPWIKKKPKVVILRPEGYHAHFIEQEWYIG